MPLLVPVLRTPSPPYAIPGSWPGMHSLLVAWVLWGRYREQDPKSMYKWGCKRPGFVYSVQWGEIAHVITYVMWGTTVIACYCLYLQKSSVDAHQKYSSTKVMSKSKLFILGEPQFQWVDGHLSINTRYSIIFCRQAANIGGFLLPWKPFRLLSRPTGKSAANIRYTHDNHPDSCTKSPLKDSKG